jgi:hypothetical protein
VARHRTSTRTPDPARRPGRVWLAGAVAGATVGGLLALVAVVTSPAQAAGAIPIRCSADKVVLEGDGLSYELQGTCGVVVVKTTDTQVDVPSSRKLVVRGHDNVVTARPGDVLAVRGRDHRVTIESTRVLRASSPGSVVTVTGLAEEVRVAGRGLELAARQLTDLRLRGAGHDVTARRGFDARVPGDRMRVVFRRLDTLGVGGDRNRVVVRRGATEVRNSGSDNTIRVNRRG